MIEATRQSLLEDRFDVSISKICRWFGVPRGSLYCKSIKPACAVQERFVNPIKAMIEESPSLGYPTVANLLSNSGLRQELTTPHTPE